MAGIFDDLIPQGDKKSSLAFEDLIAGAEKAPEERGFFRRVDDAVRGAADMVSFGFADEISAGLNTGLGFLGDYDAALRQERERDANGGYERLGGQIGGAFLMPGKAATSLGRAMLQGGAQGAAYGFGSGEGDVANRLESMGYGAFGGAAASGLTHKLFDAVAKRAARASIPTAEAVKQAGSAAYKAADDAGVVFTPGAIERLRNNVVAKLTNMGYDPALQPGASAVVRRLDDLQGQNVTLSGLDTVRKVAGNGFIQGNKANNKAVGEIVDSIDSLVTSPGADDVLIGNAQAGSEAMAAARDLWGRSAKADRVTSAVDRAKLQAASTGSGGNVDNATRQKLRKLVENPRGFTQQEQAALKTATTGTKTQNALRLAGKFAPTGVVSGVLSGGAGLHFAGPLGLAVPIVGIGAKAAADRMTQSNVRKLTEMILTGGKTADQLAQEAAKGIGSQALVRRVMDIREKEKLLGRAASGLGAVAAGGLADYVRR